jgi:hypothetical protein
MIKDNEMKLTDDEYVLQENLKSMFQCLVGKSLTEISLQQNDVTLIFAGKGLTSKV